MSASFIKIAKAGYAQASSPETGAAGYNSGAEARRILIGLIGTAEAMPCYRAFRKKPFRSAGLSDVPHL
jgi:hypothetical protein